MARRQEFYKGRRKKRNYAIIPSIIIVGLITLIVVLFYGMQKYAVITKEGVSIELPILNEGKTTIDAQGNEVKVFAPVDAEVVYDTPDYSYIKAEAGKDVPELRAIFVPAENINREKLQEYVGRLSLGNALVLEMKPRSGILMWDSMATEAMNYGLSTPTELTAEMPTIVSDIKERDIYLVAQISCCLDELFASRSTTITLRRADTGGNYMDDYGTWLDPYNMNVRNYVVELAKELYAMGFDEVVLADIMHPTFAEPVPLTYTRELSTTPSTTTAVCGFAVNVAKQLRDREGLLSIYIDAPQALVKAAENGQNGPLFMKMYDRVYYRTDKFAYDYNLADIAPYVSIGKANDRLVPVVENYLPENSTWVLVDVEEE